MSEEAFPLDPEDDGDPVDSVWKDVGEAEMVPPEWIVTDMLPPGLTILSGPPKSYKSTVELALMLLTAGVPCSALPADLSEVTQTGNVMGLSLEATAGVLRFTAKEGFGVEIPSDGRVRVVDDPWQFRLDQPADVKELLRWRKRLKARLLLVDTLRNAHSLDENDSGGIVGMIQPLQRDAITNNYSLLIVHHSKKLSDDKNGGQKLASANDMRGSSALFGLADATLTITAKSTTGLIYVDAVFKRAPAWQRTIQLGIWGKTSTESIDSITKSVFQKLAEGMTQQEAAASLHISRLKVAECVTQLMRIGALSKTGTPTDGGSTLVQSAVRKFAAKD